MDGAVWRHGVLFRQVDEVTGEDESEEPDVQGGDELLSVDEDHRAEEAPGAGLPVHVQHPQDLEETDAPDGRGGEDLSVGAPGKDHHRRSHHDQIYDADGLSDEAKPTTQPDELGTAAGAP